MCGDPGHKRHHYSHSQQRCINKKKQSAEKSQLQNQKIKEDFFIPLFFQLISFFLSFFFVFPGLTPNRRQEKKEQRTEDNLKIKGQNAKKKAPNLNMFEISRTLNAALLSNEVKRFGFASFSTPHLCMSAANHSVMCVLLYVRACACLYTSVCS